MNQFAVAVFGGCLFVLNGLFWNEIAFRFISKHKIVRFSILAGIGFFAAIYFLGLGFSQTLGKPFISSTSVIILNGLFVAPPFIILTHFFARTRSPRQNHL